MNKIKAFVVEHKTEIVKKGLIVLGAVVGVVAIKVIQDKMHPETEPVLLPEPEPAIELVSEIPQE